MGGETSKGEAPIDAAAGGAQDRLEIVVQAYSPRYAAAVRALLGIEGGYVDDPVDRGGTTKFGISLRFLKAEGAIDLDGDGMADFDLDMDGDLDGADIRRLSKGDAIYLYHRCFWRRVDAESFPAPIGEMLFDQAVNGGLAAARKMLQRAINALIRKHRYRSIAVAVDGVLGEKTRASLAMLVRRHGVDELVEAYREAVKDRYLAIVRLNPSQARFLKGWLNRADALGVRQ